MNTGGATAMNFNILKYSIRQTSASLSRNKWLALVSAGMIAISLTILGGFFLIIINTNQFMQNIQGNLEIAVFLEDGADTVRLNRKLEVLEGVASVKYVPKEEGLREFGGNLGGEEFLTVLAGENNPLPDLFRIRVDKAALIPALSDHISSFQGVESVDYGAELVNILTSLSGWLNRLSLITSILLAVGAVFLITITIRLSVMVRQDEVGIMKYLGASNTFIRLPFLMEGMIIGWAGTLTSVAVLAAAYYSLTDIFHSESLAFFIQPVTDSEIMLPVFGGLMLAGTLMGGVGSLISIRKFLRV